MLIQRIRQLLNVWTRPGTYAGFETTTTGWTLLGTDSTVVAQGVDTPPSVAVGGLIIQPGEVYGIYCYGRRWFMDLYKW